MRLPATGPLRPRCIVRRRLAAQGLAAARDADPAAVVRRLGAVQSQDFAEAQWALGQRLDGWTAAHVEAAFQRGDLLRTHVLRPTWHFVAPEDLRWLQALTGPRVQDRNRPHYARLGLDAATLERGLTAILAALDDAGAPLTRPELRDGLAAAGIEAAGDRLAHAVMYAELACAICSGPLRGRQHTYLPVDAVVPAARPLARGEAIARLADTFMRSHGPATARDLAWWSGLTIADCRAGLDAVAGGLRVERDADGGRWYSDPAVPEVPPTTGARFTATVDEVVVAHHDLRSVPARPAGLDPLFDRLLLVDGLTIGRWKRTPRGRRVDVEVDLLAAPSAARVRLIEAESRRLGRFLGRAPDLTIRTLG